MVSPAARGIRFVTIHIAAVLLLVLAGCAGNAVSPPPTEKAMSQSAWYDGINEWMENNLFEPGFAPFSFVYDGKCSREFLKDWDWIILFFLLLPAENQIR